MSPQPACTSTLIQAGRFTRSSSQPSASAIVPVTVSAMQAAGGGAPGRTRLTHSTAKKAA